MAKPLDELYFRWLYSQVGAVTTRRKDRTYWGFLRILYTTEFVWFVPNDDNRVMDGIQLREEFLERSGIATPDENWMALGCSFFEMLVALSRRLSFEAGGEPLNWFWTLIENIELEGQTDDREISADEISEKLNLVIWRRYKRNGVGGLFPLRSGRIDQRNIEIWYQMFAYLQENS
jgi:hypothetical protein